MAKEAAALSEGAITQGMVMRSLEKPEASLG